MGIVPILLWILFMYIRSHVDIHIRTEELVYTRGMPYDINLYISNQSIFPIPMIKIVIEFGNCFLSERTTETIINSVDGKENICLSLSATSKYCGMHEYCIRKIRIYDYLSIFQFRKKSEERLSVAILPNINVIEKTLAINNSNVLVESDLFSSVKSGDDPSELYGIRTYEQGDKMNHIHWKLSMKQDELMVKQLGLPINCAVAIMADFYMGERLLTLGQLDGIIESTLTLSLSLVYQEQIHYIIWYDEHKENCERFRVEKEEDCYEAISILFGCKLNGMSHDLLTYHEAQYAKEQYTNIFYITSFLTEEMLIRLNNQRKSAITYLFFLSEQDSEQGALLQYGEGLGIKTQLLRLSHISDDLVCES